MEKNISESTGMDLVISFDTTGSMFPVLSRVRQEASSFVRDMFNEIKDLRVSVIAHGDYCDKDDPYTIRLMDFTKDQDKICEFINTTKRTYGGDADECYELVLNTARKELSWEAGRIKVFVLIGDASPHGVNYYDNKDKIDWNNEAGLLNDLGVKIFAVHALSYYRSGSAAFYKRIASVTGGKYLTLDQFNEVIDVVKATCISEYGEEKLNEFISVIRARGRMTHTMASNISRLSGKSTESDELAGKRVQSDGLVAVNPGRFQVMTPDEDCAIKKFVEDNGITFKRGRGFYELTKHETVQQYKEVIIQDRETGEMFTGAQVREKLGLQPQIERGGVKENLSSKSTSEFRVFVQSTSFNRKLIAGTAFLYEVDDLEDTGSVVAYKEDKADVKAKAAVRAKATVKAKSDAKAKETTEAKATVEAVKIATEAVEEVIEAKADESKGKNSKAKKSKTRKAVETAKVAVEKAMKAVEKDIEAVETKAEEVKASRKRSTKKGSKVEESTGLPPLIGDDLGEAKLTLKTEEVKPEKKKTKRSEAEHECKAECTSNCEGMTESGCGGEKCAGKECKHGKSTEADAVHIKETLDSMRKIADMANVAKIQKKYKGEDHTDFKSAVEDLMEAIEEFAKSDK